MITVPRVSSDSPYYIAFEVQIRDPTTHRYNLRSTPSSAPNVQTYQYSGWPDHVVMKSRRVRDKLHLTHAIGKTQSRRNTVADGVTLSISQVSALYTYIPVDILLCL